MRLDDRLPYSAITQRPPLRWPGGARVAIWVAPNVEHYEYVARVRNVRDPYPRTPHPDVAYYATRDYGNRVGIWRMFEALDRHSIRATVSLSLAVLELDAYQPGPELAELIAKERKRFMGTFSSALFHQDA